MEQKCSGTCQEVKSLSDFHVDSKRQLEHKSKCKVCVAEHNAKWQQENKETISAKRKERYRKNPHKERASALLYKKKYPAKDRAAGARRRAAKLQRTPAWADDWKILQFYIMAQKLTKLHGVQFAVDHVIPLQGKLVSGLHVENNLQIITFSENSKKNNKFTPGRQE